MIRTPLARNILRMLAERGWTRDELAVKSGVSKSTINCYLTTDHEPTLKRLCKIRKAFGCSWDELLEGCSR